MILCGVVVDSFWWIVCCLLVICLVSFSLRFVVFLLCKSEVFVV